MTHQKFNLRVVPWWTDDCSTFLGNVFKWFPALMKRQLKVLEFGGGNSSLYLLSKGLKVVTVESSDEYIQFIDTMARGIGFKSCVIAPQAFHEPLLADHDLVIVKACSLAETDDLMHKAPWDFIVNDGVSRKEVLQEVHEKNISTVIILDNVEYCANWGKLDRSSAKPDLIQVYRELLRDSRWRNYAFEQAEGREGHGQADKSGWESPHRWISAVIWPHEHVFTKLMVSHLGFPIVNADGLNDFDLQTLSERCPFDWQELKWLKPNFPPELDLKLTRNFN